MSQISNYCPVSKAILNWVNCNEEKASNQVKIACSPTLSNLQEDWEKLVAPQHSLSFQQCLIFENCSPANISYRYLIGYKNNIPICCAVFQVVILTSENLKVQQKSGFVKAAAHLMLKLYDLNILVCGNIFREGVSGFVMNANLISEKESAQMLSQFVSYLNSSEHYSAILYKDVAPDFTPEKIGNVLKLEEDISMLLTLNPLWTSFSSYIQSLSKKYIARAKKILDSAKSLKTKELNLETIQFHKSKLHSLYCQVLNKQSFFFGELSEDYLVEMKKTLGDAFRVKGFYLKDELIAFYTTLDEGEELEVHYVGMDYQFNQAYNLYFNIHFNVLEEAILLKKQRLNMGRTALEAKAILGCKPVYNNTYIRFKCALSEFTYNYFMKDLKESNNWKTRNPLKTSSLSVI